MAVMRGSDSLPYPLGSPRREVVVSGTWVRTRISEHPALYLPIARRKYPGTRHLLFARRNYPGTCPEVVGSETELVIDGYTRCATTFAVYAFQLAQERPVRVVHHVHAPAQLIVAAKMGIPVLALIREPREAILSQLIREPGISLRGALVAYARFYSSLMPQQSGMVVGQFDEATQSFGSVVRKVNDRLGTSFTEFEHNEANLRACLIWSRSVQRRSQSGPRSWAGSSPD
jgi:hypothetical protein